MPEMKLAFVNFFKEKTGSRRLVHLSEFDNFNPTHHCDYDDNETYLVKWAHLPAEGSSSTEGLYEAKVLCLGVDLDDLKLEAKVSGLKITQGMISDFEGRDGQKVKIVNPSPPKAKSSRGRQLKRTLVGTETSESFLQSIPDPRSRKKKKKVSGEDNSREKRQQKSLENYDLNLFKSDDAKPSSSVSKQDSIIDSNGKSADSSKVQFPPISQSVLTQSLKLSNVKPAIKQNSAVATKKQDNDPLKSLPKSSSSGKSFFTRNVVRSSLVHSPTPVVKISEREDSGDESNTASGSASRNQEGDKIQNSDQTEPLSCLEFMNQLDAKVPIQSHSYSKNYKTPERKRRMSDSTSNTISSDESKYESDSDVTTDAVKELYYNKIIKLEAALKEEKLKVKNFETVCEDLQSKIKNQEQTIQKYAQVNLGLSERLLNRLDQQMQPKSKKVSSRSNESVKELLASPESMSASSENFDAPLQSSVKKLKPSQPTSDKNDTDDEANITLNDELGCMVLLALQKKAPLQTNGDGQVHLGNGVWISQETWNDKIRVASVSPSIALRDTMRQMYSQAEMAERSLEGGLPVRAGPDGVKNKKKKMTPTRREALLGGYAYTWKTKGVYRAKTAAASGSNDKLFLDLAVSKKGKDVIRYKLKEACIQVQKS